MERLAAAALARELMNAHGTGDVPFGWHKKSRSFGTTTFVAGKAVLIQLSLRFVEINSEPEVRDTILHEIAHARAGIAAGHGWAWKSVARSLGANPDRHCGDGVNVPLLAFVAPCTCGHVHTHARMPRRKLICRYTRQALTYERARSEVKA